jgi:hypothetical protein
MNTVAIIKKSGIDLVKGAVSSLVSFLGMIIGSRVAGLLNLPLPTMPDYMSMTTLLPLMIISGITIAIVLGECFQRLSWSFWPRLLGIGICYYLLYYVLNILDGLLFTPLPNMTTGIFSELFPSFFAAVVIAWLWHPKVNVLGASEIIATFFSKRQWSVWAWRLLVSWLIYPPVYYLIGRIAALFTLHYYEDPNLNLGLTLPSISTLLLMQILRGALFLLAVTPIIISWHGTRTGLWLWVGTLIFILIANQIIVQAYWLPWGLRIPHILELLADSFIQAGIYIWLLFPQSDNNQQQSL